jgi:chromosome segregation ATPase
MLKKLVVVGIVGFLAVAAIKGSKLGSYIRSEIDALKAKCEANVPPEKELARLRSEIKQLDKDILGVVNQLAKERVEVNQLKERIDELAAKQTKDKDTLQARANAIKNATEQVSFGDRTLSIPAAKAELEEGVKRFTANQKSLESMDATYASRVKVRDTLEKQLETLKAQKGELAAAADALEADLNMLKLQQMESKYQTDDTRLAKIKEDMRSLRTRIEIEREKLKLLPAVLDNPTKATSNKSVDEIIAPLAAPAKPATGGNAAPTMPNAN